MTKLIASNCLICLRKKPYVHKYKIGSSAANKLRSPNEMIAMDLYELSTISNEVGGLNQCKALLVIVDVYSKYLTCYPLSEKTSKMVIHSLTSYFAQNAVCKYIWSDNAKIFRSDNINKFYEYLGIRALNSSPRLSKTRGLIENFIKNLQRVIRLNQDEGGSIRLLEKVAANVNVQNHIRLNKVNLSPYEIHHKSCFGTSEKLLGAYQIYDKETLEKLPEYEKHQLEYQKQFLLSMEKTIADRKKAKMKELDKINRNRQKHKLKINDLCLIKEFYNPGEFNTKLKPIYSTDIYKIVKVRKFLCTMENLVSKVTVLRHISHIKPLKIVDGKHFDLTLDILDRFKILHSKTGVTPVRLPMNDRVRIKTRSQGSEDNVPLETYNWEMEDYIPNEDDELERLETIYE